MYISQFSFSSVSDHCQNQDNYRYVTEGCTGGGEEQKNRAVGLFVRGRLELEYVVTVSDRTTSGIYVFERK